MRRGLLEATGNVAGQNLATDRWGDRLSWGGNAPPTRWTKACNGDQQPRGEWAEKRQEFQEQAQKRCGQRLLGSSLPSPGDPLESPLLRSILALGLPFLSFLRLYPHSFFFFFLILLSPVSENISASSQPTASCVESLCLFGAHFLSKLNW